MRGVAFQSSYKEYRSIKGCSYERKKSKTAEERRHRVKESASIYYEGEQRNVRRGEKMREEGGTGRA